MTTTQFTTLIFVLLTIVSAGHLSVKMKNFNQVLSAIKTKTNYLGSASKFAVLAGSTVTSTGNTSINGSVGVAPGTAITGPINVSGGGIHSADSAAQNAENDLTNGYNTLKNMSGSVNLTGKDLGGMTLAPGVYKFESSCAISSGTLTLDGQGNSSAEWVFQIGSTLLAALSTSVNMTNGGSASNVYWQVGSSATLATESNMCGNIIAYASITMNSGARLNGRALARVGAVTLISNNISMN